MVQELAKVGSATDTGLMLALVNGYSHTIAATYSYVALVVPGKVCCIGSTWQSVLVAFRLL